MVKKEFLNGIFKKLLKKFETFKGMWDKLYLDMLKERDLKLQKDPHYIMWNDNAKQSKYLVFHGSSLLIFLSVSTSSLSCG